MKTEIVETQKINKEIKFPCIVREKKHGNIYIMFSSIRGTLLFIPGDGFKDQIGKPCEFAAPITTDFIPWEIIDEITITFKNE